MITETQSSFTYEPPTSEATPQEQLDFTDALKGVIGEIQDEYHPEPEFTDEELAEELNPELTPKPETPAESGEKAEDRIETQEDPAVGRGFERLVAREAAFAAKEQAFSAREARVVALEAENAILKTKIPAQDVVETMALSPSEAIKAMGHDPEVTLKLLLAEQLKARGQEVPDELKKFVEKAEGDRRVRKLEKELETMRRQEAYAVEFNAVKLGAEEYVKTFTGDGKDAQTLIKSMPVLAELAKSNPGRAHREIMEEIVNDARARAAAEPNGQPLTFLEAARRAEQRLVDFKSLFTIAPAQNTPTKPAQGPKTASPPQSKPPARPLKPWEKKGDDDLARGLAEAEREYHLTEQRLRRRG